MEDSLFKLPVHLVREVFEQYLQGLDAVALQTLVLRREACQNHGDVLLQQILFEGGGHLEEELLRESAGLGIVVP